MSGMGIFSMYFSVKKDDPNLNRVIKNLSLTDDEEEKIIEAGYKLLPKRIGNPDFTVEMLTKNIRKRSYKDYLFPLPSKNGIFYRSDAPGFDVHNEVYVEDIIKKLYSIFKENPSNISQDIKKILEKLDKLV